MSTGSMQTIGGLSPLGHSCGVSFLLLSSVVLAFALSCGTAAPLVPARAQYTAGQWQAIEERCEKLLGFEGGLPREESICREDARCAATVREFKATCEWLDLLELRRRCEADRASACFLLGRIDAGQPASVTERACRLGHARACAAVVQSNGEHAKHAERVLADQCEEGAAQSCVLLAERREILGASRSPPEYREAASAWESACALGAPKGCGGLARILAGHPHQLGTIDPAALGRLFASKCQEGAPDACAVRQRDLNLLLLRQQCSDGNRITSTSSCHELARQTDAPEALDVLTRMCQEGRRDDRVTPHVPTRCRQDEDPLLAYVESCREGVARHCGFEWLAGEALKRAAKACALIEPARLAPYGTSESWFFTSGGGALHVHCPRPGMFTPEAVARMNRLNAGIAFSHCWIAARHLGRSAELAILAAGQADAPEGFDDVASMKFAGRAASWSAATAV